MTRTGSSDDRVTLQVNVAPSDLPHARATLRHQLRRWRSGVDKVIYTVDLHRSAGPRGDRFDEYRAGFMRLLDELAAEEGDLVIDPIDYANTARQRVADEFFAGVLPPSKDCFGAPFYGYFYGLSAVATRYVLHMDCDMLYGGGSASWIEEARELLETRADVLFVCPLGGAPTSSGRLPRSVRRMQRRTQQFGTVPALEALHPRTYRAGHISTHVFLSDVTRLRAAGPFPVMDAPPWTYGTDLATTPYMPAETSLSSVMHASARRRLDFLGREPGMWCVHPGLRGPAFTANLPNLIASLEAGEAPTWQRGMYELAHEWLTAVGPEAVAYDRPRRSAGRIVRQAARALRAPALRKAYWRLTWAPPDRASTDR